ncbi:hypothetical protein [Arenimonas sp.]|uniref:hypothetical protein n=1 Tax=Arenimonas sp. TaxID=1872635 RepID=UPI0025B8B909|nr:hypothetical protein [Arenimonas sp.]
MKSTARITLLIAATLLLSACEETPAETRDAERGQDEVACNAAATADYEAAKANADADLAAAERQSDALSR